MSVKSCLWMKFRATCPTSTSCQFPQMPSSCEECGWDADVAWEECMKKASPIAQAVEEVIHGDDPDEMYRPL